MFYLLILLSILIEVCIVFTAPGTYIERSRKEKIEPNVQTKALETLKVPTPMPKKSNLNPVKIKELAKKITEPIIQDLGSIDFKDDVEETPPKKIPIREPRKISVFEKFALFVHVLFDNGTSAHIRSIDDKRVKEDYLKEFIKMCDEKHISAPNTENVDSVLNELNTLWKWLTKIEGPTGYVLIEKRNGYWFPNYTAELILNIFKEKAISYGKDYIG